MKKTPKEIANFLLMKKQKFKLTRTMIINSLIKKYNVKDYLEIGVCDPFHNFDFIECLNKTGVDPKPRSVNKNIVVKTSDQYFKELSDDKKFDLIFVDGLHLEEQVDKDIENGLKHLKENGFIVVHDCNPPTKQHQRENYIVNGKRPSWNGTVWRSVAKLRMSRTDLRINTVNDDWGVCIIDRTNIPQKLFKKSKLSYELLEKNRKNLMNIISPAEFKKLYL